MPKVSPWALLVAVAVQQLLGFLWYSPMLFIKPWAAGFGKRPEELQPDAGPFMLSVLGSILLVLGTSWVLEKWGRRGIRSGLHAGLGIGLTFTLPPVLVHEAFLGFPAQVLMIDGGKEIVTALVVGAIVGAWPRKGNAAG